jgi:hypothetical protein
MAENSSPGFRETRIPLAVGSLSVTAVALIVRRFLAALLDGELVGRVRRLVKLLPSPVVGAFFDVYLLGIVLHEAGGIVMQIVVAMFNLLPLAIALLALLLGVSNSAG